MRTGRESFRPMSRATGWSQCPRAVKVDGQSNRAVTGGPCGRAGAPVRHGSAGLAESAAPARRSGSRRCPAPTAPQPEPCMSVQIPVLFVIRSYSRSSSFPLEDRFLSCSPLSALPVCWLTRRTTSGRAPPHSPGPPADTTLVPGEASSPYPRSVPTHTATAGRGRCPQALL